MDIDGVESARRLVLCGVPEGAILSPFLFNVYTADMHLAAMHSICSLYADHAAMML